MCWFPFVNSTFLQEIVDVLGCDVPAVLLHPFSCELKVHVCSKEGCECVDDGGLDGVVRPKIDTKPTWSETSLAGFACLLSLCLLCGFLERLRELGGFDDCFM